MHRPQNLTRLAALNRIISINEKYHSYYNYSTLIVNGKRGGFRHPS